MFQMVKNPSGLAVFLLLHFAIVTARVNSRWTWGQWQRQQSSLSDEVQTFTAFMAGRIALSGESDPLHLLRLTHHVQTTPGSDDQDGEALHSFLLRRDRLRHGHVSASDAATRRNLQETETSESPLNGAMYPNGLYFTQLSIGTPGRRLNLNVDTGSNLLWVNCAPCQPCTTSQYLPQNPPYDPGNSSTATPIPCHSTTCENPDPSVKTMPCKSQTGTSEQCGYSVVYADTSSTSGTLYSDVLHLPTNGDDILVRMPIGCGNTQTGNFYNGPGWTYYQALDGLMGFGRGSFSVIAAITAQQKSLKISPSLAHCLGGSQGGGWLAFGNIPVPEDTPFTFLYDHTTWYRTAIVRITVGGRRLSVNPSQYGNLTAGNAILDSGTTFTILPDAFASAILTLIQRDVGLPMYTYSQTDSGSLCFEVTQKMSADAIRQRMPTINVQFAGRNVFLNVAPSVYSFIATDGAKQLVCTQVQHGSGYKMANTGIRFVVGEIWMRDYLVLHDNINHKVGWKAMKC